MCFQKQEKKNGYVVTYLQYCICPGPFLSAQTYLLLDEDTELSKTVMRPVCSDKLSLGCELTCTIHVQYYKKRAPLFPELQFSSSSIITKRS